jgi:hypothetical protein
LVIFALHVRAEDDPDDPAGDDDLLDGLYDGDALETYEIASPKESNAHWMRAIKEVVVEKKQKLGLRYGESTHTAAIEIAKARQAIRPNRRDSARSRCGPAFGEK